MAYSCQKLQKQRYTINSLLLLGHPGAGKTISLLMIVKHLLTQAKKNSTNPIPIILNLESWNETYSSLDDWIIDELSFHYQISSPVSMYWIRNDNLSLFLDGLDEVPIKYRNECVESINSFIERHMIGLLVSCRYIEYFDLNQRLSLANSVSITPLSREQIDKSLKKRKFEPVRAAIENDDDLLDLASSPLLLNFIIQAHDYKEHEEVVEISNEAVLNRHDQIFALYLKRLMPQKSGNKRDWERDNVVEYLRFIANYMYQNSIPIFYIDRLHPRILTSRNQRIKYEIYYRLVLFLITFIFGSLFVGLGIGLGYGLLYGVIFGLISGITFASIFLFSSSIHRKIRISETLDWAKFPKMKFLLLLTFNLFLTLVVDRFSSMIFIDKQFIFLLLSLVYIVGLATFYDMNTRYKEIESIYKQYQSLFTSINNSIIFGAISFVYFSVCFILLFWLMGDALLDYANTQLFNFFSASPLPLLSNNNNFADALFAGFGVGLTGAFGVMLIPEGMSIIQYLTLRFLLSRYQHLPWKLESFLSEMARSVFVYRIGGGHTFIHRLFVEFLINLESKKQTP